MDDVYDANSDKADEDYKLAIITLMCEAPSEFGINLEVFQELVPNLYEI